MLHKEVIKSGAWFSYGDERLGQGRENAKQFLRDNPDIAEELEMKIRAKMGLPPLQLAVEEDAEEPVAVE